MITYNAPNRVKEINKILLKITTYNALNNAPQRVKEINKILLKITTYNALNKLTNFTSNNIFNLK